MKKCELCNSNTARLHCESDQTTLCWDCDTKVHSANFLVAKHSRSLLCHSCQSITPWACCGPKMGPTLSTCHTCVTGTSNHNHKDHHDQETNDDDDDNDDDNEEDDDGDSSDDEDDGDNQVVPLSSLSLLPPIVSSSSGSHDEERGTSSW